MFRSYRVILDGQQAGTIGRGRTIEVPLAAGRHEIFLKIDWCQSPVVEISAQAGEVIRLACAPGGPASGALADVIGGSGNYISLGRA
jgi:hypothetical protein